MKNKTHLELRTAIDLLDEGHGTRWIVANLSDDAYQLATHCSERINAVGLSGLIEDIRRGNADRSDLRAALVAAREVA